MPTETATNTTDTTTTALATVDVDGWKMATFDKDTEPRVRDVDLAERLGKAKPRNIRSDVIEPHLEALKKLGEIVCRSVRQTSGGRPGKEYWLNKDQALYVAMHSGTKTAGEVSVALIQAYGKLRTTVEQQQQTIADLFHELQEKMGGPARLLPYVASSPISRGIVWDWDLAEELAKLYGLELPQRSRGYPAFMAGFIGWLYDLFPKEIIDAIRERSKEIGSKRHEMMTDLSMDELRQLQTMLRTAINSPYATSVHEVKDHIVHAVAAETARRLGIPRSISNAVQVRLLPFGRCRHCGAINQSRAQFCSQCGTKLG